MPLLPPAIEDVGILRIGRDVAGLRAAGAVQRGRRRTAAAAAATTATAAAEARVARHADRAAVLLRAADVIRNVLRRDDVVILRRRKVLRRPVLPAGDRHRAAAVVPDHQVLRIVGIDPQVVMIAVRAAADAVERLAAVGRADTRSTFSM